jgi:hypothetical protein
MLSFGNAENAVKFSSEALQSVMESSDKASFVTRERPDPG